MSVPDAPAIFDGLAELCMVGAALGCCYLFAACVAVLRFRRQRRVAHPRTEPVTILKPLHGAEPDLTACLASFCDQAYAGPIQMVCGVRDAGDEAINAVRRLMAERPDRAIELTIDGRDHGRNRKVSNLANMLPLARHNVTVISDSDMAVPADYLANIAGELQQPDVGAVTCLYHGVASSGRWSQYAALAINTHFLPNVVAALSLGLATPCFGSTIAMRRSILMRIGGFDAFAGCLADDYAIGDAVRSLGYNVAIPAFSIGHVCFEPDFAALVAHEIRAARTIKAIDPLGYFGSVVTHPLPLALFAALLGSGGGMWWLVLSALAGRIALCFCVEHAFGLPRQPIWLIPLRDLLSFAVFVSSYLGSTVTWRGVRYGVTGDGGLAPDERNSR